jgi:L-galactose dehydrogenase
MIYRELGKTGLKVSIIGFGAAPLGDEYGTIDPQEGERAVHYAIEQGINYFDVSPFYGLTLAETRLGQALLGHRHEVILATKVGRYGLDDFDFSARRVTKSLEDSLTRLRTDYVDVLQAHDIEFAHRQQIINETLPAMYKLKEAGKVRCVGITAYPVHLLKAVAESAQVDTIMSYCRYNLMDTSMQDVLTPVARRKGIALINASPLHMSALTEKGEPSWHPAPERVFDVARQAVQYCRSRGASCADLALQFALAYPEVATTLIGMSKVSNVERNVRLIGTTPDSELLAEVLDIIKPVANTIWEEGLPENFDPGALPQRPWR